jgi:hypothetical protein
VESVGGLDWVQVFSLDVLDQGYFQQMVIRYLSQHDGYFGETCFLGCTEAALTSYELVSVADFADYEGLDDSVGADGLGEFGQAVGLEDPAGLEGVSVD